MLTVEMLARTVTADREREVRERHRDAARSASGPRHPVVPEWATAEETIHACRLPQRPVRASAT